MTAEASPRLARLHAGDLHCCTYANRLGAHRSLLLLFRVVSRLGDGVFWYLLIALLAVVPGWANPQAALHMAAVGLVALMLYKGLKRWTRRPRPFRRHGHIRAWVAPLDEFSFPSGHTLHAVSFTLVALYHVPELAPLLIPFTLLVAASRVVLGLHYPSDVLAATVIGVGLAEASIQILA